MRSHLAKISILTVLVSMLVASGMAAPAGADVGDAQATVRVHISDDGKRIYTVTPPSAIPEGGTFVTHIPERISQPLDAFGCAGWVCIKLDSTPNNSNYIDMWETTAINEGPTCTEPYWLINDRKAKEGDFLCVEDSGTFFAGWDANRFFPSPSHACNTWYGYSVPTHKPCKTIKK